MCAALIWTLVFIVINVVTVSICVQFAFKRFGKWGKFWCWFQSAYCVTTVISLENEVLRTQDESEGLQWCVEMFGLLSQLTWYSGWSITQCTPLFVLPGLQSRFSNSGQNFNRAGWTIHSWSKADLIQFQIDYNCNMSHRISHVERTLVFAITTLPSRFCYLTN